MTQEECQKNWERFYRTKASKAFAKGSGLGLSIEKELVEMHGGTIRVESEKVKGATFSMQIPLKRLL
jgi:signal transduction histidine kinase